MTVWILSLMIIDRREEIAWDYRQAGNCLGFQIGNTGHHLPLSRSPGGLIPDTLLESYPIREYKLRSSEWRAHHCIRPPQPFKMSRQGQMSVAR